MKSTKTRIELLTEAVSIEKERAILQAKLDGMVARLNEIKDAVFTGGAETKAALMPVVANGGARSPQGTLKQRILDSLAAAGSAGIRVRDLAIQLDAKPAALHSWFQGARKSLRTIRKAGLGRYRLIGSVPPAASASLPCSISSWRIVSRICRLRASVSGSRSRWEFR